MPPPIAGDTWLAGRRFGIVIDAGSSGSRLQIYSWRDPRVVLADQGGLAANTLPKVEKGTQDGEGWVTKVEPGISSFADHPEDIPGYLRPLLAHARDRVPPSLQAETPLYLLATAGMRLLEPEQQASVLRETCNFFVRHSYFKIDQPSAAGPCGSSVRIITGEEEGLFGWIAVNYLMDGFSSSSASRTTYGFLDMGGASTQIAFEPSEEYQQDKNLTNVRLRLLSGKEIEHRVFVATWLGYGTNQARERYVGMAINEFETTRHGSEAKDVVSDPCLPKNLELTETPVHTTPTSDHAQKAHRLLGTGSFEQCMKKTSPLLNQNAPCPDTPCLMNGIHVPPIDFSVSHFIGVSEYWFSSEHVFGLGGPYSFVEYERAASTFCSREWGDIVKQHENSQHPPSGDGEVVNKDGQVVEVGKWGPQVELPRLRMQCFKAAWLANVLHEGLGMPRLVDPGGNSTSNHNKVAEQAEEKGLGRPTFQSVDTVGDIAISWTLGKMVIEASKEVPTPQNAKPIVDPIDDIPDLETSPVRPIRPFSLEALENRISPHLPYSLTRPSLGFSPVILFYILLIIVLILITWPLWRRLRPVFLRTLRRLARPDFDTYALEEGLSLNGNGSYRGSLSTPPSPRRTWHPFQKFIPRARPGSRSTSRSSRPPSLNLRTSNLVPDPDPIEFVPLCSRIVDFELSQFLPATLAGPVRGHRFAISFTFEKRISDESQQRDSSENDLEGQ
ncbi:Golgi apyrase [Marasmius crinis-equi]|uniref:Golgi apyrase n=1 Tax=Marasmius crinis-equi TaxID=585013 RepID=A0ABR3ELV7_9AGAR